MTPFPRRLAPFAVMVAAALSCGDPTTPSPEAEPEPATVGPEGGTAAANDGAASLPVPPGALRESVEIRVSAATVSDMLDHVPAEEYDADRGTVFGVAPVAGTIWDLQPDGLEFLTPATIVLRYEESALPDEPVDFTAEVWNQGPGAASGASVVYVVQESTLPGDLADSCTELPGSSVDAFAVSCILPVVSPSEGESAAPVRFVPQEAGATVTVRANAVVDTEIEPENNTQGGRVLGRRLGRRRRPEGGPATTLLGKRSPGRRAHGSHRADRQSGQRRLARGHHATRGDR